MSGEAPFGDYQLLTRLAVGGMAEVWLAKSFGVEGFERRVVIKRILPRLGRSKRFLEMFVREAKISALLSHPNIVQVYELGRTSGETYIAMEHISGRDLTQTVRRLRAEERKLPLPLAVHVAASVARGLAYAHRCTGAHNEPLDIVHRDVSPHNVMLSFQGEVKLLDFGIARLAGDVAPDAQKGRPGGGKYAYMSPEQASGASIDHRSDIFSCGIVLYELLVNHRLFQHQDPSEKLRLVQQAVVPDPRVEAPEVPEALWDILQKTLQKRPEDRYQSASELEEALRVFLFEAGHRADDATLAAFLAELYADDLAREAEGADLQKLVAEMGKLHEEPVSEPSVSVPGSEGSRLSASDLHGSMSGDALAALGSQPVGEVKSVSVVAAELLGLTEFSERAEPERLLRQHELLGRIIRRVVDRWGGWLEAFSDERLRVVFGVPLQREDDEDRALACARELARLSPRLKRRQVQVTLAVGVHRGHAALIGTGEHVGVMPRGDAAKLAHRLAAYAEPGEVVVSAKVATALDDRWQFAAGSLLRARAGRPAAPTFRLLGRRRRSAGGVLGRWVRRGDELDRIGDFLQRLARGDGGSVLLYGPNGSGKSRIIREIQGLALRAGVPFYAARASAFGSGPPLELFRRLVGQALGLDVDASPKAIADRVPRLTELRLKTAEAATLASLFALDLDRGLEPDLDALFAAAAGLVRGLGRERPTLLIVDDVDLTTPLERRLLAHLLDATTGDPVLWLLAGREAREEGLPEADLAVELQAFDARGTAAIVKDLLGADEVSSELSELIEKNAQGNPLYVHELVKALTQAGAVTYEGRAARLSEPDTELDLPASLTGLIEARVDALEPEVKRTLQLAATIGLVLPRRLLEEAAGPGGPDRVAELVRRGFLDEDLRQGRLVFASQLMHQLVAGAVLGGQLRAHHKEAAATMERLYAEHLQPHYQALARHHAESGELVTGARYANLAGELDQRRGFLDSALASFLRGVSWLERAEEETSALGSPEGLAVLHLKAGEVELMLGKVRDAERHLEVALELASEEARMDLEIDCYLSLGRLLRQGGHAMRAVANLEEGLALSRALADTRRQVALLDELGNIASDEGRMMDADALYEEALALAGEDSRLEATALVGLARRAIRHAEGDRAGDLLERAMLLAEALEDRILVGRIRNNLGALAFFCEDYALALEHFEAAWALRRDTGYRPGLVVNAYNVGSARWRLGEPARAALAFQESRSVAASGGLARGVAMNDAMLAMLDFERDGDPTALDRLRSARAASERLGDGETAAFGLWLEGRVLAGQGDPVQATVVLQSALQAARGYDAPWLVRDVERELAALP